MRIAAIGAQSNRREQRVLALRREDPRRAEVIAVMQKSQMEI